MTPYLWDLLRCPRHPDAGPLAPEGGLPPSALRCTACHTAYPVRDGIPDMLDPDGPFAEFLKA
jgi:uncharacterized protein YbaR (Trm112 family)